MRVAQVGAGGTGGSRARILARLGMLAAVCDPDRETGDRCAQRHSVCQYGSLEDLLAPPVSEGFEAALVCTPAPARYEIVARLLGARKHVLVEGLPARGRAACDRLLSLATRNRVVLAVGCAERFDPVALEAKGLVSSGKYGELVMLEFHGGGPSPPHAPGEKSIILDEAVRGIGAAMWMFGRAPGMAFATAGRTDMQDACDDFASVMLGFGGGRIATISSCWVLPARMSGFRAVCSRATVSADLVSREVRIEEAGGNVQTMHLGGRRGQKNDDSSLLEIQNFVESIRGSAELGSDPRQAADTAEVAEAALLSSQNGVPTYLDLR